MKLFPSIFLSFLLSLAVVAQNVKIQDDTILAEFSVSDSTKVYFSQGNLQYQASTNTWRFAEHQWDFVGDSVNGNVYENGVKSDNAKISPTYEGWIDLFGWGTSGWESGANAYEPYSTSIKGIEYCPGGDCNNDLIGSYANADWGVYNAISNGGNQTGLWRTLTNLEWTYLIYGRVHANCLMGQGKVNNVNGLILLPDGWKTPSSVKFTYGLGNDFCSDSYLTNVYSQEEWAVMQSYGAVFLPAAGCRQAEPPPAYDYYYVLHPTIDCNTTDMLGAGFLGEYWSSSAYDKVYVGELHFDNHWGRMDYLNRFDGLSVRLVQNVKK